MKPYLTYALTQIEEGANVNAEDQHGKKSNLNKLN